MSTKRKRLHHIIPITSAIVLTAVTMVTMAPAVLASGSQPVAAGWPGNLAPWTTGDKQGIGTAFYDVSQGKSHSNVWFTLANGALSEVYYPDVTTPDLASLQFYVHAGSTLYDESQMKHQIHLESPTALLYQQMNTSRDGQVAIQKTYVADPSANAVILQVHVSSKQAALGGVYLYALPHMNNDADKNVGRSVTVAGQTYLIAARGGIYQAIAASTGLIRTSTGYYQTPSDPLTALQKTHQLGASQQVVKPGGIAQAGEIGDTAGASLRQTSFSVALGYGSSQQAAIAAARAALGSPYPSVETSYVQGWSRYLHGLDPAMVGSKTQYNVALMTVKALEDKLHPGAFAASITIPWGQDVYTAQPGTGGYHLVWARDLYEMASALFAAGDTASMKEALHFLAHVQQLPDGSFPQNSWLDGTAYWSGLQMDEVSYPIIMAYDVNDTSLYNTMVKKAANFLIKNGPATGEERWEEAGGYSPSTMAAEIAALVCAGYLAREVGDVAGAQRDLATADAFRRALLVDTVSKKGPFSKEPYFIRVSYDGHPDDGSIMSLANGGGSYPQNAVVDAGFLELVRLGILSADSPLVVNSLNVVDREIMAQTPIGPMWHRYNHDGYGQKSNGQPYDGSGVGWLWPVFDGERGEYAIALQHSARSFTPAHVYDASTMLAVMAKSANAGYMIPEQTWNGPAIPADNLYPGQPTDSANPLGWSMAQYIRLERDIATGRVLDMPAVVAARYVRANS